MILTCPQCETRFVVPSTAIPSDGRTVRCAKCEHSWLQRPIMDEAAIDDDEIPPIASFSEQVGAVEQPSTEKYRFMDSIKNEIKQGYKSILLGVFIVMIGYAVYALLTPSLIIGQGLTFSAVEIVREGDELIVRGDIVNTMNDIRGVPGVSVTTMFDDVAGDTIQFAPPSNTIDAGISVPFEYKIGEYSENITDLKLGFKTQTVE